MPRYPRESRPQSPERSSILEKLQETQVGVFAGEFMEPMCEAMQEFQLASGVKGVAATASKYGSEQFSIPEHENQDRFVVGNNLVAVIDGIGGKKNGGAAAQLIAENILRLTPGGSIDQVMHLSVQEIVRDAYRFEAGSGACVAAVRVLESTPHGRFIEVFSLGDCRVILVDAAGNAVFETEDDTSIAQQVAEEGLSQAEALVASQRNLLIAAVSKNLLPKNSRKSALQFVPAGGRAIIVSDGVMDNFSTSELLREAHEKKGSEAIRHIDQLIDRRLQWRDAFYTHHRQAGLTDFQIRKKLLEDQWQLADPERNKPENCFADGFQALPKRDDRTMIILDF